VLEYAIKTSQIGLHFSCDGPSWDDAVVCTITDASFCNEQVLADGVITKDHSQQGYIVCLAPPNMLNAETAIIHPIAWSSTVIRRVCRATLMAEAFALTKGVEAGARIRAAIVDAKGKLNPKNWEESAAAHMSHVWLTDCDSLYEHLMSPKNTQIDNKRLSIDLAALRQDIWERNGERTGVIDSSSGDYPRWIDTSAMLADPLTKVMSAQRLDDTMMTGFFDIRPTAESLAIKERNRVLRKNKREQEKSEKSERTTST
jgi:hypothetical protein